MASKLLVIDAPYSFYSGVIVQNEVVIRCAPKLAFMLNWNEKRVREHCAKRGWTIIEQ